MAEAVRIAMWPGPRTISTALMRARERRYSAPSAAGVACTEADYTLPQLYTADEVFVTGTMGGLAPVVAVDGRQIGTGKPGPVTRQLTARYADLTATSGTPVG